MHKFLLLAITLFYFAETALSQNEKELEKKILDHREIIIKENDSIIRCHILVNNKEIKPKGERAYYWYDKNSIHTNIGSFSGNLLDGDYEVTNVKGDLISQGKFKNGQKDGKWLTWHINGKLKSSVHWNNGNIFGKINEYETNGKLVQITPFKKNIVNGTVIKFTDKTTIKKHYWGMHISHTFN